jgi:uncharacterized protein (DUF736 family)
VSLAGGSRSRVPQLDDPSFPAPIYASLLKGEGDDSYTLIWSRRTAE